MARSPFRVLIALLALLGVIGDSAVKVAHGMAHDHDEHAVAALYMASYTVAAATQGALGFVQGESERDHDVLHASLLGKLTRHVCDIALLYGVSVVLPSVNDIRRDIAVPYSDRESIGLTRSSHQPTQPRAPPVS